VSAAIVDSGAKWGHLGLLFDKVEDVFAVARWGQGDKTFKPGITGPEREHYLSSRREMSGAHALWYRATPKLHDTALVDHLQRRTTPVQLMQEETEGAWLHFKNALLVLTYCERDGGQIEWAAWFRQGEEAFEPIQLEVFDHEADLLAPLDHGWDRATVADELVTVVGVGSIGGAACESLAGYGFRRFALVDPDRLRSYNFARHRVLRSQHGRFKVYAVADLLRDRDPTVEVERHIVDVGSSADVMRPLIRESGLVVCCADGAEARRVSTHLAFWAGKPIVLGCVLHFGAYGEVLRLQAGRTGCLVCNREALKDALNLEAQLQVDALDERITARGTAGEHTALLSSFTPYEVDPGSWGTTAVTSDLHLVGNLVGKTAAATVSSRAGYRRQRLPGSHALIALQPLAETKSPFAFADLAGRIHWLPTAAPHLDCPTCGENVGW
jgi:molybdopterin/thiamine biosynthesis adenylyltransferase